MSDQADMIRTHAAFDKTRTPLHACSLEAIPEPVVRYKDGSRAWPVLVGCYQLEEGGNTRQGRLALHLVKAPGASPKEGKRAKMPHQLSFGTPHLFPEDATETLSGVLDGKWFPKYEASSLNQWWYATACSTGDIQVYGLTLNDQKDPKDLPFKLCRLGQTAVTSDGALCLALNWDIAPFEASITRTRIVSSYSNGRVALHNVVLSHDRVILEESDSWTAHCLFGNIPTQVWTACFAGGDSDDRLVLTGGDDAKCKLWDVRCTTKPAHVLSDFDAGVTVVSAHPRNTSLVAVGSYDESVAIYDVRSPSKPLLKESFGGGIWRIQWHPLEDNRLLLAVMHGGCRVVQLSESFGDAATEPPSVKSVKEFTRHESMAYGADWLVCGSRNAYYEAAASCSFYDQAAYLWDTVGR